ncbi:MAG: secondary thiamine-phosphate synthase enzyme YjbQ [Candidatus Marinimicrobia bacterium]|nr:secondary thiamine-phosphate synthase enzyme YjbQ [Candidatus Neomarinimicrobiota bacterium]
MVFGDKITVQTKGFSDIKDITGKVQAIVDQSGLKSGIATITAIGSTASVTTIEFEPALVQDMQEQLEKFASRHMHSHHSQTWGDDNGFSHIRASFMGPGITIPFTNGKLVLGTWQQIVVIDHDNRPRQRQVFVQVIEE